MVICSCRRPSNTAADAGINHTASFTREAASVFSFFFLFIAEKSRQGAPCSGLFCWQTPNGRPLPSPPLPRLAVSSDRQVRLRSFKRSRQLSLGGDSALTGRSFRAAASGASPGLLRGFSGVAEVCWSLACRCRSPILQLILINGPLRAPE